MSTCPTAATSDVDEASDTELGGGTLPLDTSIGVDITTAAAALSTTELSDVEDTPEPLVSQAGPENSSSVIVPTTVDLSRSSASSRVSSVATVSGILTFPGRVVRAHSRLSLTNSMANAMFPHPRSYVE